MLTLDLHPSGRHFSPIPRTSPVPDRILRAMSLPTIVRRRQCPFAGIHRRDHAAGGGADAFRQLIRGRFDLSLGTGLGKVKGRVFPIEHLGDSNDLTPAATFAGVKGLKHAGVTLAGSGVQPAMIEFAARPGPKPLHAAA